MLAQSCRSAVELAAKFSARLHWCEASQLANLHHAAAASAPSTGAATLRNRQAAPSRSVNTRTGEADLDPPRIGWVFLGPPGVGKGTYSTRVAIALGVSHIAAGDLVRFEMRSGSRVGSQVSTEKPVVVL
jgi:Adenylate kinase